MSSIPTNFQKQFGPWGLVAGASEGLGSAYAQVLAKKGLNVALIARRKEALEELKEELESDYGVETKIVVLDLTTTNLLERLNEATNELDIGVIIYNAALSPIGLFHHFSPELHQQVIDLNCRGPMLFCHYFGKQLIEKERGGILLMSSMAGMQGTPIHAHYSATKAYNLNLAEGLRNELQQFGINVTACVAGEIKTPNYLKSNPKRGFLQPPAMTPLKVAETGIKALQKNKPIIIPGFYNKLFGRFIRWLLPRRMMVKIMGNIARNMYGEDKDHVNP
jgi:hypothetical protein